MSPHVTGWGGMPRSTIRGAVSAGAARRPKTSMIFGFLIVHVALAFASYYSRVFSTIYALGLLAVGLAIVSSRRPERWVAVVVCYVCGAELIWRGTEAYVFWEYGKYAIILLITFAVLRTGLRGGRELRGLVYFALLVPSLLALPYFDRTEVAFNLSGPLSLAAAVTFFSRLEVDRALLSEMMMAFLAPVTGLAALSTVATLTTETAFSVGSKATTAGIGPNQMSTILGLGVLAAFLLIIAERRSRALRMLLVVLGLWLAGQCMMTFSRGGFWAALGAVFVASLGLMASRRNRMYVVVAAVGLTLVFTFVIFPAIDSYSGGVVKRRFADPDLTGRDRIMRSDLQIFLDDPVLGVGPGQAYYRRGDFYRASSPHTEFTRTMSEHGILGIGALLVLGTILWSLWRRKVGPASRAISLSFAAWASLTMGHAAMRLAAPGVIFGLATAWFMLENLDRARRYHPNRDSQSSNWEGQPLPTVHQRSHGVRRIGKP